MKKLLLLLLIPIWSFAQSPDGTFKTLTATMPSTDAYAISEPLPASYEAKEKFIVTFPFANTTTTPTLNRNGLGAKLIKNEDGTSPTIGSICACRKLLSYNGTYFQIVGGSGNNTLSAGHIYVGNVSNVASDVPLSGDGTLSSAGSLSVLKIRGNTIPANAPGQLTNNGSGTLSWSSGGTVAHANGGNVLSGDTVQWGDGDLKHDVTITGNHNLTFNLTGNLNLYSDNVFIKPNGNSGSSGQFLQTDGNGKVSWQNVPDATTSSKGIASFTASDFDVASGVVSIDYTNGQASSGSTKGFLTSADWTTFNGKQSSGNYITALTGDITASGPGSVAATLATVNSNVGTFGSATKSVTATVNGKGLITAISEQTVTPAFSSLTGTPTTLSGYGITDAQPLDSDLTTIAGLTATTDNFMVSVSSAWASRTPTQVKTTLGFTTIGNNIVTSANPSAITFLRGNADNSVDWLSASNFRTAIGAGTGSGTVTSIATTSPITGGTITSTGTIACATCVTSAASLTSNNLVIGGGSQATSTTTTGTGVLTALGVNTGSSGAFVVNGGALGTPTSGTATNLTGTASGLTAGTVTTNANLTGPITSVGNATSIASQTGTGTTFMMSASPSYTGTLTSGTLGYSDTGILMSLQSSTNSYNQFIVQNTNSGASASSSLIISNDIGTATTHYGEFTMNSSGFTGSGSFNLANAVQLDAASDDLVIGTLANKTLHFVTNNSTTDNISITGAGIITATSNVNGSAWNSTWTATANSQISKQFTDNVTLRSTASDVATALYINPTLTLASTTQNPVGLNLDVTYVQTGGVSTLGVVNNGSLAGMTATTYTNVAPSSTSGSGTGALFTVVVGSATSITSITQTTAGSGYKVLETVTFSGSQFGSGSGSAAQRIRTVSGQSLGTSAAVLRTNVSGSYFLDAPKLIDFQYTGTTLGSIGAGQVSGNNAQALAFFDQTGAQTFYILNGTGVFFNSAVTLSSTVTMSGALTLSAALTQSTAPAGGGSLATFGITNTAVTTAFTNASSFASRFKSNGTITGLGLAATVSLTTGGTGYTTGIKTTTGGTGSGATVNITTVSGGVITAIASAPPAKGTNYVIGDILTLSGGTGGTVTVTAVDFAGNVLAFDDAASITDAKSNYVYSSFYGRPTYNITSTQIGTIAGFYYNPTLTATGSFNNYGLVIVPTGTSSGIGTSAPTGTLHLVGSGSIPTLKTVGVGTGTNYSHVAYQSDGTTIIQFLKDNGDFQVGLSGSKTGFYGTTAISKPSGNLVTAISNLGLVTSPTIATTDVTNLLDGTYTPSLTGVTNISASTAYVTGYYRIGNSVTVFGKINITTTLAASTASEIAISLPIASNLAAEEDLGGTAISDALASETARIKADATNDRASVVFKSISISGDSYSFEFSYQVK